MVRDSWMFGVGAICVTMTACVTDTAQQSEAQAEQSSVYCADYRTFTSYRTVAPQRCAGVEFEINESEFDRLQGHQKGQKHFQPYEKTNCVSFLTFATYQPGEGVSGRGHDVEVDKAEYNQISGLTVSYCRTNDGGQVYKTKTACEQGDVSISLADYEDDVQGQYFMTCEDRSSGNRYKAYGSCFGRDRVVQNPAPWPTIFCKYNDNNYVAVSRESSCRSSHRIAKAVYMTATDALKRMETHEDQRKDNETKLVFSCPLPRGKFGVEFVLKFHATDEVTVGVVGGVFAGVKDPEYSYKSLGQTYGEKGLIVLFPKDDGGRELGLLEFSKVRKVLNVKDGTWLRCREGI